MIGGVSGKVLQGIHVHKLHKVYNVGQEGSVFWGVVTRADEHHGGSIVVESSGGSYMVMQGMIKMYKVEVLGKHPVIKHQYFGTIIPY